MFFQRSMQLQRDRERERERDQPLTHGCLCASSACNVGHEAQRCLTCLWFECFLWWKSILDQLKNSRVGAVSISNMFICCNGCCKCYQEWQGEHHYLPMLFWGVTSYMKKPHSWQDHPLWGRGRKALWGTLQPNTCQTYYQNSLRNSV